MTVQMPTYSEKVLNQFAEKENKKAISYLRKTFSLSEDDCNDVFQESFIVLFNNVKNGKVKKLTSSLSTYFISICCNKAHELLKSQKRSVIVEDEPTIDLLNGIKDDNVEDILIVLDGKKSLIEAKEAVARQIVHDLPEPCNELLWGFFRDNYSLKTLADMLNKSVGYVKVTKHRCQEKFRTRWSELTKNLF